MAWLHKTNKHGFIASFIEDANACLQRFLRFVESSEDSVKIAELFVEDPMLVYHENKCTLEEYIDKLKPFLQKDWEYDGEDDKRYGCNYCSITENQFEILIRRVDKQGNNHLRKTIFVKSNGIVKIQSDVTITA